MSLLDKASLISTPNGFKASKLYSIVPSSGAGDLDVVRATTATRINGSGLIESVAVNVPRIDYTNGSCPSLLVEPQRTNLLTYSQEFDNAAWVKTNTSVTANSTLSPDGTQNADTLTKSATGVDGTIIRIVSATATGYVGSIFVKKDTNTSRFPEFFVRSSDAAGENEIYVQLNTSTGATAVRAQTGTASVSVPVLINDYWRISFYALANSNTCRFGIRPAAGSTLGTFSTNTTGSIIAYGAQLEVGTYATSYIPTVASSVTRNADFLTRAGFGNTSTSGTLFFDLYATKILSSNGQYLLQLFAGSTIGDAFFSITNGLSIIANGNAIEIRNNAFSQTLQTITPTSNQRIKIAIRYNGTNISSAINGTLSSVLTDTSVGVKNAIRINNGENGTHSFNSVMFFPSYLSNSELQSLTII